MKILLKSLILSHLYYCVAVWGPSLDSALLERLQRMQNHTVRLCCSYFVQKYDHMSAFYHRLSWLSLPCLIQFRQLCLMYHQCHRCKCFLLEPPLFLAVLLTIQEHLLILLTFLCFTWVFRVFSVLKLHNGGIHYHPLQLIVLISHFISMWMPLDSIVAHCIDFMIFVLLYCFLCLLYCFFCLLYCFFVVVVC